MALVVGSCCCVPREPLASVQGPEVSLLATASGKEGVREKPAGSRRGSKALQTSPHLSVCRILLLPSHAAMEAGAPDCLGQAAMENSTEIREGHRRGAYWWLRYKELAAMQRPGFDP